MKMVRLLVRSPSVATPDNFSVDIGVEQSISELKQTIEGRHQASPLAREMRIIWRGRVLPDTDTIKSICTDEETLEAQTVHFVLNSPVKATYVPRRQQRHVGESDMVSPPLTPSTSKQEQHKRAEADSAESNSTQGKEFRPSIVPLSNQFQYVLVNGVPYLMVLQADTLGQQQQQQLSAALVSEGSSETQTLGRLNSHLEMRNRMLQELEETSERLERLMARNRTRDRVQRDGDVRVRRAAANEVENEHPLADVQRNFNFGAIWNVGWVLLRMMLLILVFAHDASLSRIMVLVAAVGCIYLLRDPRVQQHLAWLNQHNPNQVDDDDHRQQQHFSIWEKTKALAIALLTSLVPSEPFQARVAQE
ncbi:hypothetical protein GGI21_001690 [Coemansia aciculifera]|nr:hypothetical protein GGI21_001690 [Coemansia aciculifera]